MANQNVTARYLPQGVNRSNVYLSESILGALCAATDTITVAIPQGVDPGYLPLVAQAYVAGTPVSVVPLTITSINSTTGVVVLTNDSGGGIAAGSKVVLALVGG